MKAELENPVVEIVPFNRNHLEAVMHLCEVQGWPSYLEDAERTWRALTAPGVITVVAVDDDKIIGFTTMLTDGEISSYLSLIAVAEEYRSRGIARRLVEEVFTRSGPVRQGVNLLSTEGADGFFQSFANRSFPGYRIYPLLPPGELSQ
jgi:GNAT superfamily N-acetyltransferase